MANRQACKHKLVDVRPHRSGRHRWLYYNCPECGLEWTETYIVADLEDTVTADEIIDVHEALATDKTLGELLQTILVIESS